MRNIHGSFTMMLDKYSIPDSNGDADYISLPVRVEYVYWPLSPGARERGGPQIEPDTPAEIEITSVKDFTGTELSLSDPEREVVESRCFEDVRDNREYARERRAEDRREDL
jgi:hypothetical protein